MVQDYEASPAGSTVLEIPARGTAAAPSFCVSCRGTTEISAAGLFDTRFGIPGTASARRCRVCGLEQIYPVPAPAQLKHLYERFYNFGGERGTVYTALREWFFSSALYRSLDSDRRRYFLSHPAGPRASARHRLQ